MNSAGAAGEALDDVAGVTGAGEGTVVSGGFESGGAGAGTVGGRGDCETEARTGADALVSELVG